MLFSLDAESGLYAIYSQPSVEEFSKNLREYLQRIPEIKYPDQHRVLNRLDDFLAKNWRKKPKLALDKLIAHQKIVFAAFLTKNAVSGIHTISLYDPISNMEIMIEYELNEIIVVRKIYV